MKSKIAFSIAACTLALSLSQAARADSLNLHFRDDNVGVGIHIGNPPVPYVVVPQPVYQPYYGDYRQGWVAPAPAYVYPTSYWGRPRYYREAPRWERERHHEWRERDRHDHGWRDGDRHGDEGHDRGRYGR
jgi:hypothetical protein